MNLRERIRLTNQTLVKLTQMLWHSRKSRQVVLGAVFVVVMTGLMAANMNPEEVDLKLGQISPEDIVAPRAAVFIDETRTAELRKQAAAAVQKVYQEDDRASAAAQDAARGFFQELQLLRENSELDSGRKLEQLRVLVQTQLVASGQEPLRLEERDYRALLETNETNLRNLEEKTIRLIDGLMARSIKEEDLPGIRTQAGLEARRIDVAENLKTWSAVIAGGLIRPTLILNQEATNRLIEDAQSKVTPVERSVKAGQILVRKGDPVSAADIEALKQLGIQRAKSFWVTLAGMALLVLVLTVVSLLYLRSYHREIFSSDQLLALLALLVIITMLAAKVFAAINFSSRPELSASVAYIIPSAVGPMMMAILLNPRIGIFGTIITGVLIAVVTGLHDVSYIIVALVSGLVGVFSVARVDQGWDLAKGGLLIGGVNVLVIVALGMVAREATMAGVLLGSAYGIFNGLLSAVLTTGILPYLEAGFKITSSIRLLELANPNQPLLKRLLIEAPGTYHHSVIVGNLADAAAETVGAHSLLVRVAAYYHDIGKVKRPYFFIENQHPKENPHDKLSPNLSSLIITSHVKDGVDLARQAKLPQVIVDIISQHHGNSLVAYFYHRALETSQPETVDESSYRYDAPKPQSKEAALVMLADAVEAAIRSLQKPTPGRVEGLVRRVIKERLNDGQLDESDLTFKDLDAVAGAFVRVLSGIYHTRIEYPDFMLKEETEDAERRKGKHAALYPL